MAVPRLVLRTNRMVGEGVESDDDDNGGVGRHDAEMDTDVDWKKLFYFERRGRCRWKKGGGVVEVGVDGILKEGIQQVLCITLGKYLIAAEAKMKVNKDSTKKNQ